MGSEGLMRGRGERFGGGVMVDEMGDGMWSGEIDLGLGKRGRRAGVERLGVRELRRGGGGACEREMCGREVMSTFLAPERHVVRVSE